MALFDHTDKGFDVPLDLKKEKKLSKLLGTTSWVNKLAKLGVNELGNFRYGAGALAILFSSIGYYFYRQYYRQNLLSSTAYYKLMRLEPLDAGKQFFYGGKFGEITDQFTYYYRMPLKEFDISFRMKSAYINGEFDHDKEILIPNKKNGVEGYDVFTPFYYYYKARGPEYLQLLQDGKPCRVYEFERAALPVHRGW